MTFDGACGHVEDALRLPLSDGQTLQTLLARANGADLEQLLAAALAVAREQLSQKIDALECALDDSKLERWQLKNDIRELQARLASLSTKRKRNSPAATLFPEAGHAS